MAAPALGARRAVKRNAPIRWCSQKSFSPFIISRCCGSKARTSDRYRASSNGHSSLLLGHQVDVLGCRCSHVGFRYEHRLDGGIIVARRVIDMPLYGWGRVASRASCELWAGSWACAGRPSCDWCDDALPLPTDGCGAGRTSVPVGSAVCTSLEVGHGPCRATSASELLRGEGDPRRATRSREEMLPCCLSLHDRSTSRDVIPGKSSTRSYATGRQGHRPCARCGDKRSSPGFPHRRV